MIKVKKKIVVNLLLLLLACEEHVSLGFFSFCWKMSWKHGSTMWREGGRGGTYMVGLCIVADLECSLWNWQ